MASPLEQAALAAYTPNVAASLAAQYPGGIGYSAPGVGPAYDENLIFRFDNGNKIGVPDGKGGFTYQNAHPIAYIPGQTYAMFDKKGKVIGTASSPAEMKTLAAKSSEVPFYTMEQTGGPESQFGSGMMPTKTDYGSLGSMLVQMGALALPAIGGVALGPLLAGTLGTSAAVGTGLGTALGTAASGITGGKSVKDILLSSALSGLAAGGLSALTGPPTGLDSITPGSATDAALSSLADIPISELPPVPDLIGGALNTGGDIVVSGFGGGVGSTIGSGVGGVGSGALTAAQQVASGSSNANHGSNNTPDTNPITVTAATDPGIVVNGTLTHGLTASQIAALTGGLGGTATLAGGLGSGTSTGAGTSTSTGSSTDGYTGPDNGIIVNGTLTHGLTAAQIAALTVGLGGTAAAGSATGASGSSTATGSSTDGYTGPDNGITVTGKPTPPPPGPPPVTALPVVPPLTALNPNIPTVDVPKLPEPSKGPLSKMSVSDWLRLGGLATGLFGNAVGGNNNGTIPGGFGTHSSQFTDSNLGPATIPGLAPGTGGQRDMSGTDWAHYGEGPEQSFFNYVPQTPKHLARGGLAFANHSMPPPTGGLSHVSGPGDGREDKIPAMLSDGEYVMDAETVALLGNGSNKAGAHQLDAMRANIRKQKGKALAKGSFSVNAKRPEAYLKGGRV